MNKERIELSAKAKLEDVLSRLGYVTPEIPSNDKTPSWDGFIRLYNNEESAAKSLLCKMIPMQLKGHYQKAPYSESTSFDAEIDDLRNYFNHNGVFFIVVYLDETGDYKIYYNSLTRLKIRRLLKGREFQKTISIHLQGFPVDNRKEAIDLFFAFTLDMEMSLPNKDITLKDVFTKMIPGFDTFKITYRGVQYKDDPFEYFLTHPTTASLQNSQTGITFPVDTIFLKAIYSKHKDSITINGIQYYDSFDVVRQKSNNLVIHFGKSFSYDLKVSDKMIKGKFNYRINGNITERIKDTRFLLAYLENKYFEINSHKGFYLSDEQISTVDKEYFRNNLNLLVKTEELLTSLKSTTVLDYDMVSETEEKILIQLINTVLLGKTCIPDNPNVLYKINIANIELLLIAEKIDDKNYKIINYFSDENKVQCAFSYKEKQTDKDMFHIPRTYILRKSDFATLDNINYDMVYNEILASQTSDELKEYTFYFIQEMISGYEQREKNRSFLLDCILKALSFLNKTVAEYPYSELINNFEAIQCKKID